MAKRRLREGQGCEADVTWLRAELRGIACDLSDVGEFADTTEPGD